MPEEDGLQSNGTAQARYGAAHPWRRGDFCNGDFCNGDFCNGDFCNGDFCNGDFCNGDFLDF